MDFTPVLRLKPIAANGCDIRATIDGQDVTSSLLGDGLIFFRQRRLLPGTSRRLLLHVTSVGKNPDPAAEWALELSPHPTELDRVNQRLLIEVRTSLPG